MYTLNLYYLHKIKNVSLCNRQNRWNLFDTIRACIRPGTTIISDLWTTDCGIPNLPGMNFLHLMVKHSQKFVDPVSRAHMQTVESLWAAVKRHKRECGTSQNQLDSYLCEFMWRYHHKDNDLFQHSWTDIHAYWPPQ